MHCVCCFRWCRCVFSWTVCFLGFVHFSSSSFVSCSHLSLTTSNSNLPCLGSWLKFWCKVDGHWSNKLFWPIRTGRIFQPQKWLEILRVSDQNGVSLLYIMLEIHHSGREPSICKCQRTITPHQCTTIRFARNKLASLTSWFAYFLDTLSPYSEKYGRTSILPADFCTNMGKYRRVGGSAKTDHDRMFCQQPSADVFRRCTQRKVKAGKPCIILPNFAAMPWTTWQNEATWPAKPC